MLITRRTLLGVLATRAGGFTRDHLRIVIVREWWNNKHLKRLDKIVNSAISHGFAFLDHPEGEDKPGVVCLRRQAS